MKKIKILLTLSLLLLAISAASGQPKHKTSDKANHSASKAEPDNNWQQLLYHGWKLVKVSGEPWATNTTNTTFDTLVSQYAVNVDFRAAGLAVINFSGGALSSPFSIIKQGNKRYLLAGSTALEIRKLNKDSLLLKMTSTIMSQQSLMLTLVPAEMPVHLLSDQLANNWKRMDLTRFSQADTSGKFSSVFAMQLEKNGDCSLLRNDALQHGKWSVDEDKLELLLDIEGKKERYNISVLMPSMLTLIYPGKEDSVMTLYQVDRSPADLLNGETNEVPPPPVASVDTTTTYVSDMARLLPGTWKAVGKADYLSNDSIKLDKPVTLTIRSDSTFILQNGKKKVKGRWHYDFMHWGAIVLTIDKQQRYCPLAPGTAGDVYSTQQLDKLSITIVLPGEEKLMQVDFERMSK